MGISVSTKLRWGYKPIKWKKFQMLSFYFIGDGQEVERPKQPKQNISAVLHFLISTY
jgi:hypothetical protein